jgi:hypothetical protein
LGSHTPFYASPHPLIGQTVSAAEAKAIRKAIASEGPTTASPSLERPYPRILIVPKDVEEGYAKKPEATVRLLLKIVDGGEPWASIHASACIHALVWGPQFGWMATHVDNKTWDDPIAEGRETRRESDYNHCVRLIAEKEKNRTEKKKR